MKKTGIFQRILLVFLVYFSEIIRKWVRKYEEKSIPPYLLTINHYTELQVKLDSLLMETNRESFSSVTGGRQYEHATRNPTKETSYSRVISNYRLSDWMKKYCIAPSSLFQTMADRAIFTDQHGVKRYVDNWQPVPAENDIEQLLSKPAESFFFLTGCMKMSHIYDYYRRWCLEQEEEGEEGREDDKSKSEKTGASLLPEQAPEELQSTAFISEWQRLWIFLENHSDHDSLAEYAPLFRLLIEFLFHPRIQTIMMVLLTYNYCVNIALTIAFPNGLELISVVYIFFELAIQTIAYFAIVVVYKGIVTEPPEPAFPLDHKLLQELTPNAIFNNLNAGITTINSGLRESFLQVGNHVKAGVRGFGQRGPSAHDRYISESHGEGPGLPSNNTDGMSVIDEYTTNPMRPTMATAAPRDTLATNPGEAIMKDEMNRVNITAITHSTNVYNHFRLVRNELFSRIRYEISRLHPLLTKLLSHNSDRILMQQKQKKFLRYKTRMKKLSYHEILNIALKFLIDVNHINMQTINFDRKSYRLILLFIVILFPLYLFINSYYLAFIYPLPNDCPGGISPTSNDEHCQYMFYFFILTLGTLTKYFVQLIFAMSIMVALVSLSYGAEIAFRLTDAWIKKFKSLRRVEEYDMEEYLQTVLSLPPTMKPIRSIQKTYSMTTNRPFATTTAPLRPSPASVKKGENDSHYLAAMGSTRSHRSPSFQAVMSEFPIVSKRPFHFESEKNICEHPLYYWVKRDAVEHYFFICEVFQAMDTIWSPALTFIFILGLGLSLVYALYVFFDGMDHISELIALLIFVLVRLFVLLIYPLMSLCHANSYIYELTNSFRRSSTDDFQLIGGCEQWVDFMEKCPAAWTYNGIWITWDRLLGFIWTFAAAGAFSGIGTIVAVLK